jgi:phosphotransferase system HPr (HPr) family protein
MVTFEAVIQNEVGLHARPASVFVQTASKFASEIKIRKLNTTRPSVSAKSILQVLMLGVCQGDRVELAVEGGDETAAADALKTLLDTNFAGKL